MHHSSAYAPRPSRQRLRGGMSVTMMLVLLGLVGMLGLVEVGYLYWAKRDAQKVVDLASMAGAQRLDLCSANRTDNSAARGNAQKTTASPARWRSSAATGTRAAARMIISA